MSTLFDMGDIPEQEGKSNEWYTPHVYIEAARTVMGSIDLDPASCELANRTVKASRYYTKEDNGLAQDWHGCVWMNPPYLKVSNKTTIGVWVTRLCQEYRQGKIEQAVTLLTSDCDASWFSQLWDYLICFPTHNVYFNRPTATGIAEKDSRHGHWLGSIFVYLGPNEAKFTEVFSQFGRIAKAIDERPQPLPQPTLWDKGDLA